MPSQFIPTLFVGLGGTGHLFISRLKQIVNSKHLRGGGDAPFPLIKYMVVDSEFISIPHRNDVLTDEDVERLKKAGKDGDFSYEQQISSTLESYERIDVQVVPDKLKEILGNPDAYDMDDFIPENVSAINPGMFGASQVGLLGKIMGFVHFNKVFSQLRQQIDYLMGSQCDQDVNRHFGDFERVPNSLAIYVACSLGGGTGRGLYLTVAAMIRHLLKEKSVKLYEAAQIILVNFDPDCFQTSGRSVPPVTFDRIKANQYAAFKELDHILTSKPGGKLGALDVEKLFKAYLGKTTNTSYLLPLYDAVLLISPKLEDARATELDSYSLMNDIASSAIASAMFEGFSGDINASLCNKGPGVKEIGTNQERVGRYARMGRASLRFPVERIVAYLQHYFCYHATLDLVEGHLSRTDKLEVLVERFTADASSYVRRNFTTPAPITFEQLGDNDFDTPFDSEMKDRINAVIDSIHSNHTQIEKQLLGLTGCRGESGLEIQIGLARELLIQLVETNGIEYALAAIDNLIQQLHLRGAAARGRIGGVPADLGREEHGPALEAYIEELYGVDSQPYRDGSHAGFENIRSRLEADRKSWEKKRNFMQKLRLVGNPPRTITQDSQRAIESLNTDFQQNVVTKLCTALAVQCEIQFNLRFESELSGFAANLRQSLETLRCDDEYNQEFGLIRDYRRAMDEVALRPMNPTDIYVDCKSRAECEAFADDFRQRYSDIESVLQAVVNDGVVPGILDGAISAETVRRVLEPAVKRQVADNAKGLSISHYFKRLFESNRRERIDHLWEMLYRTGGWMGTVDMARVKAESKAQSSFKKFEFLEMADPDLFQQVRGSAGQSFGNQVRVHGDPELRETIVFTRYQFELPLFVIDSIYNTWERYDSLVRGHDEVDQAAAVLAMYHTSKDYFYLDEPLARVTLIPESEESCTINLMLHLGVLSSDSEGVLVCPPRASRGASTVGRWLEDEHDSSSGLLFDVYSQNTAAYPDLTQHLLNQTAERLFELADPTEDAYRDEMHRHLDGYLVDIKYPLVPQTLLENRLRRRSNQPGFQNFFTQRKDKYARKLVKAMKKSNLIQLYRSSDELVAAGFADPADLHAYFLNPLVSGLSRGVVNTTIEEEDTSEPSLVPPKLDDEPSPDAVPPKSGDGEPDGPEPVPPPINDVIEQLERLVKLKAAGELDEDSFQLMKASLMQSLTGGAS